MLSTQINFTKRGSLLILNVPVLHYRSSSAPPQFSRGTPSRDLSYFPPHSFAQCWKLHARSFAASRPHSCRPQRGDFFLHLKDQHRVQSPASCSVYKCVYAGTEKYLVPTAIPSCAHLYPGSRSCQGHVSYLSHIFVSLCLLRQLGALYPRIFLTRHFELLADDCVVRP